MKAVDIPVKISIPFAFGAGGAYIETIPDASQQGITPGRASFTDGFPPLNFVAVNAGGIPPLGKDMNGIHFAETSWLRWLMAGGPIIYDATFQAAIGGYPNRAVVQSALTAGVVWRSTADDNLTNPDSGGAGWALQSASGSLLAVQTFAASGQYTPTPGMRFAIVKGIGGGGGGGGGTLATGSNVTLGSPGGSASYGEAFMLATALDTAPKRFITIGDGGVAVAGDNGTAGGDTYMGPIGSRLFNAPGGLASTHVNNTPPPAITGIGGQSAAPTVSGTGSVLLVSVQGGAEAVALAISAVTTAMASPPGGRSQYGMGAPGVSGNVAPSAAANKGSGGGGSVSNNGIGGTSIGSNGAPGFMEIWEYA